MRLICVGTRQGNAFMNEILEAIAFEARQLGDALDNTFRDAHIPVVRAGEVELQRPQVAQAQQLVFLRDLVRNGG